MNCQLLIGNDMDIIVEGLRLRADDSYVNDATLTATVEGVDGATCDLDYVSGSNGNYLGVLPGTIAITADTEYRLTITGTEPRVRWTGLVTAGERGLNA